MRDVREEIIEEHTYEKEGLMIKYYKCTYCGNSMNKELKVSNK
jgi:hypothetical protein